MAGVPYTAEQLAWLKENYETYPTARELTSVFNWTFGACRTEAAIRVATNKLGLKRCEKQNYTAEEDAWLTENYPKYRSDILRDMFVEKFGHKVSPRGIISHCNGTLGLISGRQNYQKGETPANCVPIGTERKTSTGYIIVKVNDKKSKRYDHATYHENWEFKHILEWEKHHSKIPPKHMIVFLDSNKENLDIDNLYCVPQRIGALMARNKWYTDSREHTLTAIKWCELKLALGELEEQPCTKN